MDREDIKCLAFWALAFAGGIWLGVQIGSGVGDFLGHVL